MLEQLTHWHWLVMAVVLVVLEVFMPSAFFLWFGVSAGIVGLLLWMMPGMSWEVQIIIFSILSISSIVAWRMYLKKSPTETDHPKLNRRGEQYVGRVFTLEQGIENGTGKIRVDDTNWKIIGEDLPVGAKVRVTGVEGTVLTVIEEK